MLRSWHSFQLFLLALYIITWKKTLREIIAENRFESFKIIHKFAACFHNLICSFTEIVPSFEPRDVTVKKGVDAKEFYDLLSEIGR